MGPDGIIVKFSISGIFMEMSFNEIFESTIKLVIPIAFFSFIYWRIFGALRSRPSNATFLPDNPRVAARFSAINDFPSLLIVEVINIDLALFFADGIKKLTFVLNKRKASATLDLSANPTTNLVLLSVFGMSPM